MSTSAGGAASGSDAGGSSRVRGPRPRGRRASPGAAPMHALRGGIDLGGTKIEAIVVDKANKVLGSARHPTPTTGTPADVAKQMAAAMTEAASAAADQHAGAGRDRRRLARHDRRRGRHRHQRPQPAGLGRNLPGGPRARQGAGHPGCASATTCRSRRVVEFELGAGRPYESLIGVFWGTGMGGGLVLDWQTVARPRRRR